MKTTILIEIETDDDNEEIVTLEYIVDQIDKGFLSGSDSHSEARFKYGVRREY